MISLSGPFTALIAALVWGCADFTGGQATRRSSAYQVLVLSGISGGAVLLALALLTKELFPASSDLAWALAAGSCGALGLGALYSGLSLGNVALVAPVAAVTGALLPVVFALFQNEPPSGQQWVGFTLALLGIWLVTRSGPNVAHLRQRGLILGLAAGIGFGCFFILVGQIRPGAVFAPLFFSRMAMLMLALLLVWLRRERLPRLSQNPLALLAGLLDAGGNVLYLLAAHLTRLDVAAVLSSLYPGVTVLLAAWLNHEKLTRSQWVGLLACLTSVMLITGSV